MLSSIYLFKPLAAADKFIGFTLHLWGSGSNIRFLIDISRLFIKVSYSIIRIGDPFCIEFMHGLRWNRQIWKEVFFGAREWERRRGRGSRGSSNKSYADTVSQCSVHSAHVHIQDYLHTMVSFAIQSLAGKFTRRSAIHSILIAGESPTYRHSSFVLS